MASATPFPGTSTASRIFTLDVMRGFALLGILSVNIFSFSTNNMAAEYIPLTSHKSGPDYHLLMFFWIVCEGKMRGLFTLLFGAGIILATSEKEKNGLSAGDYHYRRMLWLLVFGLADAYLLLWRGDILYEYALCGMLLFAFRGLRGRWLIILGLTSICIFLYGANNTFNTWRNTHLEYLKTQELLSHGAKLNEEQNAVREKWVRLMTSFPPWRGEKLTEIKKELKDQQLAYSGTYSDMFKRFKPDVQEGQSSQFYRDFWESLGMILLGMGLLKTGFLSGRYSRRTYLIFALICIGAGYFISWSVKSTKPITQADFFYLYTTRSYTTMIPWQTARVLTTLGYAAFLVLFCQFNFFSMVRRTFANAGKMALTNYIMQTLICSTLFYSIGFGLYGQLKIHHIYFVVVAIFIFQMAISTFWLRYFEMGPLEWLWRSLIYWKKQPNRRSTQTTLVNL